MPATKRLSSEGLGERHDVYKRVAERVQGLDAKDIEQILKTLPENVVNVLFFGSRTFRFDKQHQRTTPTFFYDESPPKNAVGKIREEVIDRTKTDLDIIMVIDVEGYSIDSKTWNPILECITGLNKKLGMHLDFRVYPKACLKHRPEGVAAIGELIPKFSGDAIGVQRTLEGNWKVFYDALEKKS